MKWVLVWQRLGCSSVVEHSPSMHRALDLIPSTTKIIFKKEELEQTKCNVGKILSNLGGLGWPTPATEFCNYTACFALTFVPSGHVRRRLLNIC